MLDGRKLERLGEPITLEEQGFALVQDDAPTKVRNWEDPAELRDPRQRPAYVQAAWHRIRQSRAQRGGSWIASSP